MAEWNVTDMTQFVRKDGEKIFSVVDVLDLREVVTEGNGPSFCVNGSVVDLDDYNEGDINDYVEPYGYEFKNGTLLFKGTSEAPYGDFQNQIIAECVAETEADEKTQCADKEELRKELARLGIANEIKEWAFGIYFENE